MTYEISLAAERDIKDILRETVRTFGTVQLSVYQQIISAGVALVSESPERPGSLARSEIAAGVRFFHLELAAGRRGGAAHGLYYVSGTLSDGSIGTIILRVLHEHMEPRNKVIRSLSSTKLRQRYTLEELTTGVTPDEAHASSTDVDWATDVGREIIDEE